MCTHCLTGRCKDNILGMFYLSLYELSHSLEKLSQFESLECFCLLLSVHRHDLSTLYQIVCLFDVSHSWLETDLYRYCSL